MVFAPIGGIEMTSGQNVTDKKKIVQLRRGEPLPASSPRRYREGRGYIRLRWKVGVKHYVEAYEHRFVMGLPPVDVHHKDGVKDNNIPGNLEALTKSEHTLRHWDGHVRVVRRQGGKHRNAGARERIQREKRARREAREAGRRALVAQMVDLYGSGMDLVWIGDLMNLHHTNVYRALAAEGIQMRTRMDYCPPVDPRLVEQWHDEGVRASEMLRRLPGVGRKRLYALFDELGLTRFPAGRPRRATR